MSVRPRMNDIPTQSRDHDIGNYICSVADILAPFVTLPKATYLPSAQLALGSRVMKNL
jgi:hypothetical protein